MNGGLGIISNFDIRQAAYLAGQVFDIVQVFARIDTALQRGFADRPTPPPQGRARIAPLKLLDPKSGKKSRRGFNLGVQQQGAVPPGSEEDETGTSDEGNQLPGGNENIGFWKLRSSLLDASHERKRGDGAGFEK